MDNGKLTSAWWTLRIALGLVPVLTGIDKFFYVLANWIDYLNPAVVEFVRLPPEVFIQCVGAMELVVGLAILTRWTKLGAYLEALWLAAIAANLITMGQHYDVALANLVLAAVAFTLGRLTGTRHAESESMEAVPIRSSGILKLDL